MEKKEVKEFIKEFIWNFGKYTLLVGAAWFVATVVYPILPFGGELSAEALAAIMVATGLEITAVETICAGINSRSNAKTKKQTAEMVKEQEERAKKELEQKNKEIAELKKVNEEQSEVIKAQKSQIENFKKEQTEIVVTASKLIVEGERLKTIAEQASKDIQDKLTEKYDVIEQGLEKITSYRK